MSLSPQKNSPQSPPPPRRPELEPAVAPPSENPAPRVRAQCGGSGRLGQGGLSKQTQPTAEGGPISSRLSSARVSKRPGAAAQTLSNWPGLGCAGQEWREGGLLEAGGRGRAGASRVAGQLSGR